MTTFTHNCGSAVQLERQVPVQVIGLVVSTRQIKEVASEIRLTEQGGTRLVCSKCGPVEDLTTLQMTCSLCGHHHPVSELRATGPFGAVSQLCLDTRISRLGMPADSVTSTSLLSLLTTFMKKGN